MRNDLITSTSRQVLLACLIASMAISCQKKEIPEKPKLSTHDTGVVDKWCDELKKEIASFKWNIDPCRTRPWRLDGKSVEGRSLVYAEFGNPKGTNTTLIFSMVHGDEITPLYVALQISEWLQTYIAETPNARVILAPLVNPDSFYKKPRTRVNARGVDINRNFGTKDWREKALSSWRQRYNANPRRFPGHAPDSEPETVFQNMLIEKYKPQKIISIHAPLRFMDYDGPNLLSLKRFPHDYVTKCLELSRMVKAVSSGFFPGSLGNYAGQERGIPTLTLELPSADPKKAVEYWDIFKTGMTKVVKFEVPPIDTIRAASK